MTINDRKQVHILNLLKHEIFNNGTSVIKTNDTRYNPQSKTTDFLDHCISTHPEKIISNKIHSTGDSDHKVCEYTLRTTVKPTHPRYVLSRNYKEVNWDKLKSDISSNPKLKLTNDMQDPNQVCNTIQEVVTYYLDQQAPVRKIQITKKIPVFTTSDTREVMNDRDNALKIAIQTDHPDDWRLFRNLKNRTNRKLSADKKKYINDKLSDENNEHDRWNNTKEILGWKSRAQPALIMDRGKNVTNPKLIANAINHSLIAKVAKIIRETPKTQVNPIFNYKKVIGEKKCKLELHPVGTNEMRKIVHSMKTSRSAGMDGLSIKLLKTLWKELEIPILRMVNLSIIHQKYPESLKTSKVIPLYKEAIPKKTVSDPTSYRGINLVNCLGKIIDKTILQQTLTYMVDNKLIHEAHHASIKGRSTTTAVVTIMDTWSKLVEDGKEVAALAMDQSAAYDLIDHEILLQKMQVLGFQPNTINWFRNYLNNRQQKVYIDGAFSNSLHIGDKSVIQGSVLSCILYLVYILDIPSLFHDKQHMVEETDNCDKPAAQTFVDDIMVTIQKETNKELQESIAATITKIETYMQANKLSLNRDKTQLMVINKEPILKSVISIPARPKNITPKKSLKFLGVTLAETLDWKTFLLDGPSSLYSQLKTRLSALKKLRSHMSFIFARNFANTIFIGKINYASEIWGGAPNYILKKFQSLQLEAAHTVIGPISRQWSTSRLLKHMDWMSIPQLLAYSSNKLSYRILHSKQPELLHHRPAKSRPIHPPRTRLSGQNKLGPRPKTIGRTKLTRAQYRAQSYKFYAQLPDAIQNLAVYKHFCKWMTKFYKYNARTPYDKLPTFLSSPTDDITDDLINDVTNPHQSDDTTNDKTDDVSTQNITIDSTI